MQTCAPSSLCNSDDIVYDSSNVGNVVLVSFARAGNFRTLFIGRKICIGFDFFLTS